MAKKVVATLKTGTGKNFTKVIKMVLGGEQMGGGIGAGGPVVEVQQRLSEVGGFDGDSRTPGL